MNNRNAYKVTSYIIFLTVVAYILSGQIIIYYKLNKNGGFTLFTLRPRLEVRANILKIEIKNQIKLIELKFNNSLESVFLLKGDKDKVLKYDIKLGPEKEWLSIQTKNTSLQGVPINILLSKPEKAGYSKKRMIETIRIDNKELDISPFYHNYLLHQYSNLSIYYPLALPNISSFLASKFGNLVVRLILGLLWILFVCQTILLIISLMIQPEEVKEFFNNPTKDNAITFLDGIAERFAIPLGFLGTVVSIWVSLELSEMDYRSFVQILEIIKIAIFTTVLGLATRIICLIRSFYKGFLYRR